MITGFKGGFFTDASQYKNHLKRRNHFICFKMEQSNLSCSFNFFSELRLCSKDIGCCCPICGLPLRSSELESHYTQELDYLAKLSAALVVSQEHKNNVSSKLGQINLDRRLCIQFDSIEIKFSFIFAQCQVTTLTRNRINGNCTEIPMGCKLDFFKTF